MTASSRQHLDISHGSALGLNVRFFVPEVRGMNTHESGTSHRGVADIIEQNTLAFVYSCSGWGLP